MVITSGRRMRTKPDEASLAITHQLKVIHLHGDIATRSRWDQLVRLAVRWGNVKEQQSKRRPARPRVLASRHG
ncbi:MAG: hypothetical protein JWR37_1243 [Mycobacterium sp.]|nr:hypothetical protein [Mycobacterium sp.]